MIKNMELRSDIISKEMIKPSPQRIHLLKPHKLSFLDQINTPTPCPMLLFYPCKDSDPNNASKAITTLKTSLSTVFLSCYPFCGRVANNLFIDNYEEGIPFIENRVNVGLFNFLQDPKIECLNQFLPCLPWQEEPSLEQVPLLRAQLNVFDCGGIAIGFCFSHKLGDGITGGIFLRQWMAVTRGCINEIINPEFFEATLKFPPLDSSFHTAASAVEKALTSGHKSKQVTRRFVFHANAIATIMENAKGGVIENPTRYEAVSAFIWKSAISASRSIPGSSKSLFSAYHVINMRRILKPRLSRYSMGNLTWLGSATFDGSANQETKVPNLHDMMALTREAISSVTADSFNALRGDNKMEALEKLLLSHMQQVSMDDADKFTFVNWLKQGFRSADFGWGKPIWSAISGDPGPELYNTIFLNESCRTNDEIEGWFMLDEKVMNLMEQDPEFLQFVTPNPSIL